MYNNGQKTWQVLIVHKQGHSNRSIAKMIGMNKCTANDDIHKIKTDPLGIDQLLELDEPVWEGRFFTGDRMSYTDIETGELIRCEVFAAPSQKVEDFIHAIRMCLESAVVVPHQYAPTLNSALVHCPHAQNIQKSPTVSPN